MPAVPKGGLCDEGAPVSSDAAHPSGESTAGEAALDLAQSVRSAKDILSKLSNAVISASKARQDLPGRGAQLEAKCQPWSRQGFFERLRSFSSATWFNKPASISPSECARHGWKNEGIDSLLCESCKQRLAMTIHHSLNEDSRRTVVLKFRAQMVTEGHGELCPWRDNPVPVSLTQLHGSSSHEVIWDCAHRMKELYRCKTLPEVRPKPGPVAPNWRRGVCTHELQGDAAHRE